MKIAIIGKFGRLYDEEYVARSFEMLGHEVVRIPQHTSAADMGGVLMFSKPAILLYCKWEQPKEMDKTIDILKRQGMKTVCWLFDLYFGYARENQVRTKRFFKSDYVFTTDGGHEAEWRSAGVNHRCVRQGIYGPECYLEEFLPIYDVIFVGSENPYFPERTIMMEYLRTKYNFKWFGRKNTDEIRGPELNKLFGQARVVVGDSVYSPNYWSNRVVETLGRGGCLVHREVPGIKQTYPDLITYTGDICNKIDEVLRDEPRREQIVKANFEYVRDNYTMDKQCERLLSYIS